MTPLQKRLLLVFSILVALTRLLAVARSLNDWDEALFSMGVDEYDVNLHHPHPPGYPLYIVFAKAVHLLGLSEFRSLQVVVLLGGFLLFPALVFLAREIGFDFTTSMCAAAIFTFLPNVWIYGGTAFSDVPATMLGLAACALLLRGRTDRRAYFLGAIVLGIAAGMRIPNLLMGAVPALIATVHRLRARDFRNVVAAILLGGAIAGGSYLGAALASGTIEQYRTMLRAQSEYVRNVDSWHNPGRPPLGEVARIFFLWPYEMRQQMIGLSALALLGAAAALVQRRWSLLLPVAMFAPFMITAWLNLDVQTAARYAIAYMALYALFAAHALGAIGRRPRVQAALAFAVVLVFVVWTWPALQLQRTSDPPATHALLWVRDNVPKTHAVYVHGALGPHAAYLLAGRNITMYEEAKEISRITPDTWVVEPRVLESARNFVWPRTNPLWKIIRRRNFEAAVLRLQSLVTFQDGWYDPEGEGAETFRWMARQSRASLPQMQSAGRLSMRIYVPIDTIQPPPTIEIWVNDALVERFVGAQAVMDKTWTVPSRKDAPNELRIVSSDAVVPARVGPWDDQRELGLRIDSLSWTPAL